VVFLVAWAANGRTMPVSQSGLPAPPPRETPFPNLSPREVDILDHLAAGLSNADIARLLHLSSKTIANNVSAILTKLQVSQRTQAIVKAREAGLGQSNRDRTARGGT
jgi:DNA-binding NarL/FixJ family response regulator